MEETDLLRERLQAITEKHHIQEDIRQRKLQLDQEKLKLQYLKKKVLREQWLLCNSTSHYAADSLQQQSPLSDQQQTRALQLNIHKIAMEVESLEREESMISTKESLILNRLKAVEKSSEDIIKEAQDSFVPKPLQVTTVITESPSPPNNSDPNTPRKSLLAMEINVTKNPSTEEDTLLCTPAVPPGELNQHARVKAYDDGRKCVYANPNPQEGSHHQSIVSKLSANEVKQLLNATMHSQVNHQYYHQNDSRTVEDCFDNYQNESDRMYMYEAKHQERHCCSRLIRNNIMESFTENWQRKPGVEHQESHSRRQEERNNKSNLRETHRQCSLRQLRNRVQDDCSASYRTKAIIRSNSMINDSKASGFPPHRSHDQKVVYAYQQQIQNSPVNYTPRDYISMDDQDLYCFSPPSSHSNVRDLATAVYSNSTHNDSGPSPLYRDNTSYIILNNMETTEPITAIFMGFQMAQDDSGQFQDFEGSLKAELVTIEDNEDSGQDKSMKKKSHTQLRGNRYPTGTLANRNNGHAEGVGDRWMERPVGSGVRKIHKKHKSCCTLC